MFHFSGPQLPCSQPEILVVLLHGYGANGNNLLPVAQAFALKNVFFWMPNGPEVCESYPNGFQWFSLQDIQFDQNMNFHMAATRMRSAVPRMRSAAQWIMWQLNQGMGTFQGPVFIGGFSQGAALAYHIGLYEMPVAGVIGFSGFFFLSEPPRYSPPLFWSHGQQDDMVPISYMHAAKKQLEEHNLSVQSHMIPDEMHSIGPLAVKKARHFLTEIFLSHKNHAKN